MIIFDGRESTQVRCLAGCTQEELIDALVDRGLWGDGEAQPRERVPVPLPLPRVEAERHRLYARSLFDRATTCHGTVAESYLEGREIWSVARISTDVRYCHNAPRGEVTQPAIVVAMRSVATRSITAVQRIYLRVSAGKVHKDGAQMLGVAGGAAMQLQRIGGDELHIAEGFETACAVIAQDHRPVWAMGSASLISALPVLEGVRRLVIWADHDAVNPRTGRRAGAYAAELCRRRWKAERREVIFRTPRTEKWDALDVWRARLAAQ